MELDFPASPPIETIPFPKLWAVKRILGLVNVFGKLKKQIFHLEFFNKIHLQIIKPLCSG